jgi:hypothetical protein
LKKELFPIGETQTGFRKQFVYKRQLIDNPLALQIPLLEAQDPLVSREFLIYKRQLSNQQSKSVIGLIKQRFLCQKLFFDREGSSA